MLGMALTASAQQTYSPFTVGARPGDAPPQACVDTAHTIAPVIAKYPHPTQWRWIIACNAMSWDALTQHLGWDRSNTLALTDQNSHITYLNPKLLPDAEHIVVHELAHIYLHSADEQLVDDQATRWIKTHTMRNETVIAQR